MDLVTESCPCCLFLMLFINYYFTLLFCLIEDVDTGFKTNINGRSSLVKHVGLDASVAKPAALCSCNSCVYLLPACTQSCFAHAWVLRKSVFKVHSGGPCMTLSCVPLVGESNVCQWKLSWNRLQPVLKECVLTRACWGCKLLIVHSSNIMRHWIILA